MTVDERGDGWSVSTLADSSHVAGMAMKARLWKLGQGVTGPDQRWEEDSERFLYIVSGSGELVARGEVKELDREDVVWIERGDRFTLRANAGAPLIVLDATSA